MNNNLLLIIGAAELIVCLMLAASGRLQHALRLIIMQGVLLGVLPLAQWNWHSGVPGWQMWAIAAVNCAVKAWLLPLLMLRTIAKTGVRSELEPLVGFSASLSIIAFASIILLGISGRFSTTLARQMLVATSLLTMVTGLFIICARRKAITQVIGFLCFENGISFFAVVMGVEYGFFIELGVLLDLLVLIFIMGIATFRIRSEFAHIDTDKLTLLNDNDFTVTTGEEK